ncbi:hemin uptake protein HemP [Roseovarius salinarum]|uniref:hemin uptake protein HemP n=1 Tax=Roseovarius salinarum TaxID=1981892 RepID=UPI000C34405C|nr:hemin uptake protein HemP [Roseovarius salinarum]
MIAARFASDASPVSAAGQDGAACHDARALTGGAQTANIVLDGQVYTLRITRAGKLILTK